MVPGKEGRQTVQTGKNNYYTSLVIKSDVDSWTINDGAGSSIMDTRKVATELTNVNGVVLRKVGLNVTGNAGDDTLIVGASATAFDGGDGIDTISYMGLGNIAWGKGIEVRADGDRFIITKNLSEVEYYEETSNVQKITYGKRVDDVQYREVRVKSRKGNLTSTDTLKNVENIYGTIAPDVMYGNDKDNVFIGGLGDDILYGEGGNDTIYDGQGKDIVSGGDGNDHFISTEMFESMKDNFSGGNGIDLLDYSQNKDNKYMTRGINVDMVTGLVYKTGSSREIVDLTGYDSISGIEMIKATHFDDAIIGDKQNNTLDGDAGDDYIEGGWGDDSLLGGLGNDKIKGGDGDDAISGGAGTDVMEGGWGNDLFVQNIAAESDVINGDHDINTVDYSSYYDNSGLRGDVAADGFKFLRIDLRSGHATKEGLNNFDTLINIQNVVGSNANDVITGDSNVNALVGALGNDSVYGGTGNDRLYGDWGDDDLYGEDGADTLRGGYGNDVLTGGQGVDSLLGEEGDDVFLQTSIYDRETIDGGNGSDGVSYKAIELGQFDGNGIYVSLGLNAPINVSHRLSPITDQLISIESVEGSDYSDVIVGNAEINFLSGGKGEDHIYGFDSNDTIYGGEGHDVLWAGNGDDAIAGGRGEDDIRAESGNDVIYQDIEFGVYDRIDGGDGIDMLDYSVTVRDPAFYKGLDINLTTGRTIKKDSSTLNSPIFFDDLISIEHVKGSNLNDTITGNHLDNTLSGGDGSDTLYGLAGNDLFFLDNEGDSEFIDGGNGVDTVDYSNAVLTHKYGIDASLLSGLVYKGTKAYLKDSDPFNTKDTLTNIENFTGTDFDDTIVGGLTDNALIGGKGNDDISGVDGNDFIVGGKGNDVLRGGTHSDVYYFERGDGADRIYEAHDIRRGSDSLLFGEKITYDQLWFTVNNNDLEISVLGTSDKVSINNWSVDNTLEFFKTAKGEQLTVSGVNKLVEAMSRLSPQLDGVTTLTDANRASLTPVLAASWMM